MKNIRQLCQVVVLAVLLTVSAFAGQITTMVTDPPPPPPSVSTEGQMQTPVAGQMSTGNSEAVDPATQVALSLLQSVMSLF